jgi:hypothetical protein
MFINNGWKGTFSFPPLLKTTAPALWNLKHVHMQWTSNVKSSIVEERILRFVFVPSIVEEQILHFVFVSFLEEQILWFVFVPSIVEEQILCFVFVPSIVEEQIL